MTQQALAAAANVSLSTIRKIEQGSRQPGDGVLSAISGALGVSEDYLVGTGQRTATRAHLAIPALRRLADTYDLPDDGPIRPLQELRVQVADLVRLRLSSQYTRLAQIAPPLIAELTRAIHACKGQERIQAAALLAAGYRTADAVAYKYGYHDLSGRLVELMRWASAQAEDPELDAATAYVRTEVFFASSNLKPGLRALHTAIDTAPPPVTRTARAAKGALHMRAAVLAGRLTDGPAASHHLHEAYRLANDVPEGIYNGTAFGKASLRIHEVAMAAELGDGAGAVAAAGDWTPPSALPAERRSHFYIDLARAQLWIGEREDAFASLQQARVVAPQHVREHPHVRDTLATLLRLSRSPSEALVMYAEWARAT
jgi:transcriptional regulator with XRE-family HTH domain